MYVENGNKKKAWLKSHDQILNIFGWLVQSNHIIESKA
jgi:hypothetical protein